MNVESAPIDRIERQIETYVRDLDGCAKHITIAESASPLEGTSIFTATYLAGCSEIWKITFMVELDGKILATWSTLCGVPGGATNEL